VTEAGSPLADLRQIMRELLVEIAEDRVAHRVAREREPQDRVRPSRGLEQ